VGLESAGKAFLSAVKMLKGLSFLS